MSECLFCGIASGKLPANIVYKDEHIVAFCDIDPRAPVHILVIPRRHYSDLTVMLADEQGETLASRLMKVAVEVARNSGLENGCRLVINTGPDGGQAVGHVHVHVLGGRQMSWPPG